MNDYKSLPGKLRAISCLASMEDEIDLEKALLEAADAIEELLNECENLHDLWQMAEGDKKEARAKVRHLKNVVARRGDGLEQS